MNINAEALSDRSLQLQLAYLPVDQQNRSFKMCKSMFSSGHYEERCIQLFFVPHNSKNQQKLEKTIIFQLLGAQKTKQTKNHKMQ